MRFTVLRSKAVSCQIFYKQHKPSLVIYRPTTRQWKIQNSMFRTSEHCFFPTFQWLKTWFELSRVKLCRNDLRGNKNYFELTGDSSYRGFELPRVKLKQMYDIKQEEINFGSSQREVRVSEGSSYRESTVLVYRLERVRGSYHLYHGC